MCVCQCVCVRERVCEREKERFKYTGVLGVSHVGCAMQRRPSLPERVCVRERMCVCGVLTYPHAMQKGVYGRNAAMLLRCGRRVRQREKNV